MWAGGGRVLRICRKQSREVGGMYAKPGTDCCAETEYRDEPTGGDVITTNARVGTDCDVMTVAQTLQRMTRRCERGLASWSGCCCWAAGGGVT